MSYDEAYMMCVGGRAALEAAKINADTETSRAENARLAARVAELEGLLREARSEILHMGGGATGLRDAIRSFLAGKEVKGE